MSKIEIKLPESSEKPEQLWFTDPGNNAVWRRGEDGICLHNDGTITAGLPYGGSTFKAFEDTESFTPLPPGTQIIITI